MPVPPKSSTKFKNGLRPQESTIALPVVLPTLTAHANDGVLPATPAASLSVHPSNLTPEDLAEIRSNYHLLRLRSLRNRYTIQLIHENTPSTAFHRVEAERRWDKTAVPKEITQNIPKCSRPRFTEPTEPTTCEKWIITKKGKWPTPDNHAPDGISISMDPSEFLIKAGIIRKRVGLALFRWANSQERHRNDQNLFADQRYARHKIKYVKRMVNLHVYTQGGVGGGPDGDGSGGGTARPARVHREGNPWEARLTLGTDERRGGEVYYPRNSANIREQSRDAHALARVLFTRYVEPHYDRIPLSEVLRMPTEAHNAVLDTAFVETADTIRILQRQLDSFGLPLYFPQFIDRNAPW